MGARVMGHKFWARELGALVGFMSKERMSDGRMKDERARDNKNVRGKVISPDKSERRQRICRTKHCLFY